MKSSILAIATTLVLCGFSSLSTANAGDVPETKPSTKMDDIPASWDTYFLDEETLEAHKGEKVRKFCLDDDFSAAPHSFETDLEKSRLRSRSSLHQFTRIIRLKGGDDFVVVGEKSLIMSLPVAGNFLIETRYCRKSLDRAKYIRFSDDAYRASPRRCVRRNRNISIQTRYHSSGFASCEIKNIYEWNGPVAIDDLKATVANEPAPIILE